MKTHIINKKSKKESKGDNIINITFTVLLSACVSFSPTITFFGLFLQRFSYIRHKIHPNMIKYQSKTKIHESLNVKMHHKS